MRMMGRCRVDGDGQRGTSATTGCPSRAPGAGTQPRRAGGSARARGIRVLHSPHSRAHARHPMIIAERLIAARCRGILAGTGAAVSWRVRRSHTNPGGRRATQRAGGSARARGIRVLHSPHSRAHARHPMIIAERLFAARCRGILANSQRPTPNSDAESRWLAEKFARPAGRPDRFAIRKTFG